MRSEYSEFKGYDVDLSMCSMITREQDGQNTYVKRTSTHKPQHTLEAGPKRHFPDKIDAHEQTVRNIG